MQFAFFFLPFGGELFDFVLLHKGLGQSESTQTEVALSSTLGDVVDNDGGMGAKRLLVAVLSVDQVGIHKVAQMSRSIPTDRVVVYIDCTQAPHHVELVLCY